MLVKIIPDSDATTPDAHRPPTVIITTPLAIWMEDSDPTVSCRPPEQRGGGAEV